MNTPKACLTWTIQAPGFGIHDRPAPATGHGRAIPSPRTNGSARATVVPVPYRLLENTMTWMTTGATHAPASRAATAPMPNATRNDPAWGEEAANRDCSREKSMARTSNIASPRTTNSAAIPTLNHGDELIVPNEPAVRMTTSPRTP